MKYLIWIIAVSSILASGCKSTSAERTPESSGDRAAVSKNTLPKPSKREPPKLSQSEGRDFIGLPSLQDLKNPPSKSSASVTDLRKQLLGSTARTLGFRGGAAARAHEISDALRTRVDDLDRIFPFASLISQSGTLPPVIVEARDLTTFAQDQIRTATRAYKIEREERFVSVPPTWRDYLFVGLDLRKEVELPPFEARPQDSQEQAIWSAAVESGWQEGMREAERILGANFKRLTRDYAGMLLYSTLLQQGIVSSTLVAESQQAVSGSKRELVLGDSLKRVTEKAAFEPNPNKWIPTITKGSDDDKSKVTANENSRSTKK